MMSADHPDAQRLAGLAGVVLRATDGSVMPCAPCAGQRPVPDARSE